MAETLQRKTWYKSDIFILFLCSLGAGFVLVLLFLGPAVLDCTNIDWLVNGDPGQHYNGWHAYQHGDWQAKLFNIDNISYPYSTTVALTDAIPLFAVVFKLFRFALPYHFQYIGIWYVFALSMQVFFGSLITRRKARSLLVALLGGILFALSAPLVVRMFGHEALAGHFVILASIYWMLEDKKIKHINIAWIVTFAVALLIHAYLAFMVLVLALGYLLNFLLDKENKSKLRNMLVLLGGLIGVFLLLAYLLGYLEGTKVTSSGFGIYSMNLDALFNSSGRSLFLPALPLYKTTQGIGYMYMGLPILITIVVLLLVRNTKLKKDIQNAWQSKKGIGVIVVCVICTFIAVTHIVTFGNQVLFTVPLGDKALSLLNIFRASGRMFWPVFYLILTAVVYGLIKVFEGVKMKQILPVTLCALIIMQYIDISPIPASIRNQLIELGTPYQTTLTSPFWDKTRGKIAHIISLPPPTTMPGYIDWCFFATENDMTYTCASLARRPEGMESYLDEQKGLILNGEFDPRNLYVINDGTFLSEPGITAHSYVGRVNGETVLFSKEHERLWYAADQRYQITSKDIKQFLRDEQDKSGRIYFFSVRADGKESAAYILDDETIELINQFGLTTDLRQYGNTTYCAITGSKDMMDGSVEIIDPFLSKIDLAAGSDIKGIKMPVDIAISSERLYKDNDTSGRPIISATMQINGEYYIDSKKQPKDKGLHYAVYDSNEKEIVEYGCFDLFGGKTPYSIEVVDN